MKTRMPHFGIALFLAALLSAMPAQAQKKDFRYTLAANGTVTVINPNGSVTVHQGAGRQVVITATAASDKVEVDARQQGNRVEARSHFLQKVDAQQGRVDYDVTVPADINVDVRAGSGPVKVENVRGSARLEADTGEVTVNGASGSVYVRTVNGPITLTNVKGGVEVSSAGGNVTLDSVSGPRVTVSTTTGTVSFRGDFAGGGDYSIINHSGAIEVAVPANASVDLTARSINGTVENDLQLQQPQHSSLVANPGKALSGVLNSGSSKVELRSFSGKIRVRKQ